MPETFAAPKCNDIDYQVNTSKTCSRCGITVSKCSAISWDDGICPSCYHRCNIKENPKNENPLLTIVYSANPSPVTLYLNKFTDHERNRMFPS